MSAVQVTDPVTDWESEGGASGPDPSPVCGVMFSRMSRLERERAFAVRDARSGERMAYTRYRDGSPMFVASPSGAPLPWSEYAALVWLAGR